jgi:hypothetical protein
MWTLFHHAAATALAIRPIAIAMVEAPVLTALMPAPPLTQRASSGFVPASRGAVPIAAIAARAEEEDLPAPHRSTDNEAK